MATVPIPDAPNGVPRMYESLGARAWDKSNSPIGEIEFSNQAFVIAAKDAADENFITISCTLPTGFVYRLRYAQLLLAGVSTADLVEHEAAIACLITENQVSVYDFAMYAESPTQQAGIAAGGASTAASGFKIDQNSVANDFGAYYSPIWAHINRVIINAAQGVSIFTARLLNNSGNGTAAMNISYRFEFDMFTIAQFNAVPMNRSVLVY